MFQFCLVKFNTTPQVSAESQGTLNWHCEHTSKFNKEAEEDKQRKKILICQEEIFLRDSIQRKAERKHWKHWKSTFFFLSRSVTSTHSYCRRAQECPDKTLSSFTLMNSELTSLLWQIQCFSSNLKTIWDLESHLKPYLACLASVTSSLSSHLGQ